ncbi:MAG: efflux RND transporter periplasmic adaptor subunit [Kofleriaceae bacterium]
MKAITFLVLVFLAACGHSHDEKGDHGHDHGAEAELPGQSVTIWANRTELFMEYPPLVVGKETRFAAHVTEMPSFKAVTAGSATVTVKIGADASLVGRVDAPANPGIFRPTVTPTKPGACELLVSVTSPQVTEQFSAGPCQVFANEAEARKALGEEEETPGRISYLKEQQWKTDFVLAVVGKRDLQAGVRANGEIRPVAGREARVAAPISGRVELASPAPLLGTVVQAGTVLATITPRATSGDRSTLASDVTALQAEVQAARAELARAERLVAVQAAPAKTVEEARTRVQVAEARLSGASGRLSQFDASASGGAGGGRRFQLRAPMDGVLVAIEVATGENVEEGKLLFGVIDLDRVWLVAQVFEPDVPRIENARLAWFTIEGYSAPFLVDESNGKLVTIGRVIDPKTRTVPVIFEVTNADGRLRIGNFTKVVIATGAPRNTLAIPESALVDDAGKTVAYVMVEGEAFERRPLRLGIRSNGWVEVLEGVVDGERVVSTGAYEVRLSAASGSAPAHGHAH